MSKRCKTKLKLSLSAIGLNLKGFDKENNQIKILPSINKAAKYFALTSITIRTVIKK